LLLSDHTFVILSASEGSHAQGTEILRFAQHQIFVQNSVTRERPDELAKEEEDDPS
jgi:hypothetical protein